MAETIEEGCDGRKKWHWYNVQADLLHYGILDKKLLSIDPFSTTFHSCAGIYGDTPFCITWAHNAFLMLSMKEMVPELVEAFSAVLEYQPFASYSLRGLITFEWDKKDPEKRLAAIREMDGVSNVGVII